jgi:hypothetical protein
MSLLPLIASLVMAGAGCAAVAAIIVTVQAQLPALRKLLADSRSLAADRAFLVQITAASPPAGPRAAARPLRTAVRGVRNAPPMTGPVPLRAAA